MKRLFGWLSLLIIGALIGFFLAGTDLRRVADERRAEAVGALASRYVAEQTTIDERATVKTVAGLNLIEVQAEQVQGPIYRATGVANTFLIHTPEGNVLFDTGLGTQAARHKRLLQNMVEGPVTHIVLSHSHADHIGGAKFWRAEFPNAQIVTHARFREGQRYLKDLEHHFWDRNRLLYSFMPEKPPESGLVQYGGVEPDVEVPDGTVHRFSIGGLEFEVHPTPGAEGDDNLVLWLPSERALFTGDFFGPLFPMVPNLFTLRGEKFRDPMAYVDSLERLIALKPDLILPSHFDPVEGEAQLLADMAKMRDATAYIHDQTIAGMNAGKSLWTLMKEVQLPPELALSEGHGKVSWNVRSIWEHYSTWFRFESTTELYPVPVNDIYPQLAAMSGGAEALSAQAWAQLDAEQPEAALHFVEIALAEDPQHEPSQRARIAALEQLLERAFATGSNYSETGWLKGRLSEAKAEAQAALQETP